MPATQTIRARIDENVKAEATAVLAKMGLSTSDAIRMLFVRVAAEKRLPFALDVPNATTQEAMAEVERGGLVRFGSVDALFADLGG